MVIALVVLFRPFTSSVAAAVALVSVEEE